MRIRVSYFAAARDLAQTSSEDLQLNESAPSMADAFRAICERHPALTRYQERLLLARNDEHARMSDQVKEGDEIAVLPPVAGGSGVALAEIRETELSIDELFRAVRHTDAGGVCVFVGTIRSHANGQAVARLTYEAHPALAPKDLRRVLEEICAEHPTARLAATHRVGALNVGDIGVVVASSAAHRDEAFLVCRKAIDRIKESVPIWKHEFFVDGTASWVNLDPPV